jgi:hypothetical protein
MEQSRALETARAAGIDLELLESNLALTPEQRVERHESALELVVALRDAAATLHEKSPVADRAAR